MAPADKNASGVVFNIQKYSVHDGPGIRTVVFLKGCPLRCLWCSNPESQSPGPELAYNKEKCLTLECCVRCVEVCTTGALGRDEENRVKLDRRLCDVCMNCADACPSRALNVYGRDMSVAQVISAVEEDGIFYSRSGGGMTLSGGEPMHQPEFATEILKEARSRRIHTAMETCGYCSGDRLESACSHLDTLLYDLKVIDSEKHREFTGVSNEIILENLKRIRAAFRDLPIRVRTPVIPGVNDSEAEIGRILEFIRTLPDVGFELLPYHRFGKPKYEYLGSVFPMGERVLDEKIFHALEQYVRSELSA